MIFTAFNITTPNTCFDNELQKFNNLSKYISTEKEKSILPTFIPNPLILNPLDGLNRLATILQTSDFRQIYPYGFTPDYELTSSGGLDGMHEGAFTYASLPEGSVENGMFVGDESDLEALIDAGKDPTAEHVEADEVVCNPAVRAKFLAQHGYEELPEGYEVHHIQPISEGGADSVGNMLLVTKAEHDKITAAHREYYGWKA